MNKNLDNVADGSARFGVVNGAGLKAVSAVDGANKALIDFSQAGHTNKTLDNVGDGSARFGVVNAGGMKGVSSVDVANKALIDFSQAGHTNKTLDNVGDGSTFARPLASALASGAVKAAHISNQATGQRTVGATLCQGSPGTNLTFSGWKNVGTTTINIPVGTASIKLHVVEPAQVSGVGSGFTGIGFAIYASPSPGDPGSPQVSHTNPGGAGFTGDLTLNSPPTGNGLTLALYVQGSGTNDSLSTTPLSFLSQTVVQILDAGSLS